MSTTGSKPRSEIDLWRSARDAADAIVALPPLREGGTPVELFLRRVEKSGSAGFRMGSRGQDPNEEPIHRVVIEKDFYLGTFVVTQDQWAAVWPGIDAARWYAPGPTFRQPPGPRPSHFGDGLDSGFLPVDRVAWYDALVFCEWLTANAKIVGGRNQPKGGGWRYCLPTEREWEYACRGGKKGAGRDTEYWNGDGEAALLQVGWFDHNAGTRTHAVTEPVTPGKLEAHPLGLFGMHGNVCEWCHDEWDSEAYRRQLDGAADPAAGHRADVLRASLLGCPYAVAELVPPGRYRVSRGGSCYDFADWCRSAYRGLWLNDRDGDQGFRVCLVRGPAADTHAGGGGAAARRKRAEAEQAEPGQRNAAEAGEAGDAAAERWADAKLPTLPPAAQPRARGTRRRRDG